MSKLFGWSYPPDDSDEICDVCGSYIDDCFCPECQKCGSYGDPKCYESHGLTRSVEQIENRKKLDEYIQKELEEETKYNENNQNA
jgi:hypothetical protein